MEATIENDAAKQGETIVTIPWDQLHDSPLQYRQTYSDAVINEIAATIRDTGRIHQPLVVRMRYPNPLFRDTYDSQDGFEIVFGHTRKRAGILAGLAGGPCVIRNMNDAQVRAAQAAENIARGDVHPLEEAQGFRTMIDEDGITADELAEQLGKSRSYVYGRLKLLALCPEVRKAVLAGDVGTEVGLLIARVGNHKLQAKALAYIKSKYYDLEDGGKKSFRYIRDLLNERFTLDLKKALFDIEDEMLVPSAGHCMRCPKRSGNAPEFEDIAGGEKNPYSRQNAGPDVCTDPDCFEQKKKAHLQRQAQALAASGKTVIDGAKARAAIGADGQVKGAYIALKDVRADLKKAKVKVDAVVIQDPRSGKTVDAVKVDDLVAAGVREKEAPKPKASRSGYDSEAYRRECQEREERATRENARRLALLRQVHAAAAAAQRSGGEARIVLDYTLSQAEYGDNGLAHVAEMWGFTGHDAARKLIDASQSMSPSDQGLLLLDVAMSLNLETSGWSGDDEPEFLYAAAKLYSIDPASTPSTAAQAQEEAPAKATKKKSKKAAARPVSPDEPELPLGDEQTDDAGSAGGSDAAAEAVEEGAEA